MGRINVLDIDTVNKIAAGEVVERPAAAVKELIENSVDAGADKIVVEIKNGGNTYIRITDNGCGIAADDVEKAFLPHSTSKIMSIEDLTSLYTMGFRGEALASISAVSNVDLITKSADEATGTAMTLSGGKVISKTEAGAPDGTTIVVRDLFFNTPARMNFLKKDATEGAHIKEVVERMILGYPSISFKFINGGREVLFSSGNGSLRDAFAAVYGRELASNMLETDYTKDGVRVFGLVGTPYSSRPNRNMQNFYVNKRWVKSKTIIHGAESAYKTMLMTGKFPVLLLNIEMLSNMTDVNVHPQKLEIKFADENIVHSAVYWAVQNAVFASQKEKEVEPKAEIKSTYIPEVKPAPKKTFENNYQLKPEKEDFFTKEMLEIFKKPEEKTLEKVAVFKTPEPDEIIYDVEHKREPEAENFKIIGQLFDTYILVEKEDKLLMIDQHAAHERINYEKIMEDKRCVSQTLMFPESLKLSPTEADIVESNIDTYEKLGFKIEQFGGGDYIVRQAPADMKTEDISSAVVEIAQLLKEKKDPEDVYSSAVFTIACKSAIKANHSLTEIEAKALVKKVLYYDKIRTCPHGRPIIVSFSKKFIEKEFKRIV